MPLLTRLPSPARALRAAVSTAGSPWVVAVLGAGVALQISRLTTAGQPLLAVLLVALILVLLIVKRPQGSFIFLIGVSCTLWYSPLVPLTIGPIRTDAGELLAFVLIALGMATVLGGRVRGGVPYRTGLVVLVLAIVVESTFSTVQGAEGPRVISGIKGFGLYLLVLPVCLFFATRERKLQLARAVMAIAVVSSALVLLAVTTGYQLEGRPGVYIDVNDLAQVTRLRPALLPLLFLATMIVVGRLSAQGLRAPDVLRLLLFLGVWAVSYNRSSWVALAAAALLLIAIRPGPRALQRTAATALIVTGVTALLFVVAARGFVGPFPQTVAARVTTIFDNETFSSTSYSDRESENRDATKALKAQPFFGVGVGAYYGARRPYYDPGLGIVRYQDRIFTHNSVIYAYLQLGLLGLLAFTYLFREAYRSVRARLGSQDYGSLVAAAAGCTLVGALLESLFNPNLLLRPSIIAFVICLALVVRPSDAEEDEEAEEDEDSADLPTYQTI